MKNLLPESIWKDSVDFGFENNLHIPKVVELTGGKKEFMLVLPYLSQKFFDIRNRIQCCLQKDAPGFNLKVQKCKFLHYLPLKIKPIKSSSLI